MRGRRWYRALAFVLAFWFCADGTERAPLHFCTDHNGAVVGGPSHGGGVDASNASHHGASRKPHHGRTDHTQQGDCCDCIGSVCCAAPAALEALSISPALQILVTIAAPDPDESSHRATGREHARPPSIGPPLHFID